MLTTNDILDINDYVFKSSPESSVDDSFTSDYFDTPSDEDFMHQLSTDLDIPLLLNPGEEEMSLLNSFLDKSPDEILSEISPPNHEFTDNKWMELDELKHLDLTQYGPEAFPNIKAEVKPEPGEIYIDDSRSSVTSDGSSSPGLSNEIFINQDSSFQINNFNNIVLAPQVVPQKVKIVKLPQKRFAVTPKAPYTIPTKHKPNIIVVPNVNKPPPKVVILDNVKTTMPLTSVNNLLTNTTCVTLPALSPPIEIKEEPHRGQSIDVRALKRQQRMIKNRESACLSRKKKKDYVTSLEKKVQDLEEENEKLRDENAQLKEQLITRSPYFKLPVKTITKTIAVCAVFCVMTFNINYLPSININRNELSTIQKVAIHDHHGRSLLWSEDTDEAQTSPPVPNNTKMLQPMCPMYVNQTESVRLALELHRLIGKPYNITNELYANAHFGKKVKEKRQKNKPSLEIKQVNRALYKVNKRSRKVVHTSNFNNGLEIYSPTSEQIFAEFFEAINRQDDTFYLVSLSPDHLLLPALNHNKTRRPKMSLLLPSMLPNVSSSSSHGSTVSLMQIDCEVLDTHLLHIKNGVIPRHLRTHGNTTREASNNNVKSQDENYSSNNSSYKPYFMRNSYLKFKEN